MLSVCKIKVKIIIPKNQIIIPKIYNYLDYLFVMSINSRFVELRKYLNLSQQKFAEKIDVIKQTINGIENDKYKPSSKVITSILEVFPNINARWLLTGEGDMLQNNTNQINDMKNYNQNDYKDRIIQLLEDKVEYLTRENERLKAGDKEQKAKVS